MITICIIAIALLSFVLLFSLQLKNNFLFFLMIISYVGMLTGISINVIKLGGYSKTNLKDMYLSSSIINHIKYLPIPMNNIVTIISLFKILFIIFFILGAIRINLYSKQLYSRHLYLYPVTILPLLIIYSLLIPKNYIYLFNNNARYQKAIAVIYFIIIYLYIGAGLLLYIFELFKIRLSWYRKKHMFTTFMVIILCISYSILAGYNEMLIIADGLRAKNQFSIIYIYSGQNKNIWYYITLSSIFSVTAIIIQIIFHMRVKYDRENMELLVRNRMKHESLSSTIMIHGMKNQILSSVFLSNNIINELSSQTPDYTKALENANKIRIINNELLEKMQKTYSTLKDVNIVLKPVTTENLYKSIILKIAHKFPDFKIDATYENGYLIADIQLLSESIFNIISNAIEEVINTTNPYVSFNISFYRSSSIIKITDNGNGIDKKLKHKIFLPFTTSKNTNNNWGLGLCYSMNIIKKHMGDIKFNSQKGKGTTFIITLPKYNKEQ